MSSRIGTTVVIGKTTYIYIKEDELVDASTIKSPLLSELDLLTELKQKADSNEIQLTSAESLPLPLGASTKDEQEKLLTELEKKADLAETQPIKIEELSDTISEDTSTSLKISPQIVDEYGYVHRQLGDNIFKGAIIAITPEHHEIHCGDSYETTAIFSLGNGDSIDVLIIVPNEAGGGTHPGDDQTQKLYHIQGKVSSEAEATVYFYEDTTVSANGTAISIFNRNRNSSNTDFLGVYSAPTVTSVGTQIYIEKIGSGKTVGGIATRADEFILRNNTIYMIRVTNNTTSSNYISVGLDYYVHPGV